MDPGLLRHYNQELAYLRELGAEFAEEFPKIAGRLSMDGVEVADPYVERLLEGFAFLAARVQLKLDAEHPRLIAHLLETVYPGFLSPVPSMTILRLHPDLNHPALARGALLPRGTSVTSEIPRGQNTRCEFRTAHELRLWPLEIVQVQVFGHAADLPVNALPVARQVRGGLRIRLRVHGGLRFNELALDVLTLYVAASGDTGWRLHELIGSAALGTWVVPVEERATANGAAWCDERSVQPTGFDESQALLPVSMRGFSGYRLVQELAALPQRFLFFEVRDLARRLRAVRSELVEVVIPLSRLDTTLETLVDASSLALHCTPAVNLFSKRLDRIALGKDSHEHHVVPDRTRPMDFEVHGIESLTGHGAQPSSTQEFLPLYATFHTESAQHRGYFTLRREPRRLSQRQVQQGPRSAYIGSEVFVSLVDPKGAPYREDLRQLSVIAQVTNRDLPVLLPAAGAAAAQSAMAWSLDAAGMVNAVECVCGPTRPVQRPASGRYGWALINHLTLNYLSISGDDAAKSGAALRSLLLLYGAEHDPAWRRQVEGLVAVRAEPVTRRLPFAGPLVFGSGVRIELEVDESGFQGGSAFVLASVLERLLARHAAINSFTETHLRSSNRGPVMHWPARAGEAVLA
jgi:type VI secretion system protein ImpG